MCVIGDLLFLKVIVKNGFCCSDGIIVLGFLFVGVVGLFLLDGVYVFFDVVLLVVLVVLGYGG